MGNRSRSALFAASGSLLGILAFAALLGVLPALPAMFLFVIGISALAALIGASFNALGMYTAFAMGAAVGVGCAFAIAKYALSNI